MKQLLLIDASSLLYRAYFALPKTFTSPDGEPTNALFGFSRILLKIMRESKPEYVAACFDRPEPTFRKKEYEAYKAQRPETPDDLISQMVGTRALCEAFGIPSFEMVGFEADDIIATLVDKYEHEKDLRITILTGDRDTLQLVRGEKVVVCAPKKGVSETITYDEKAIMEQYGLSPGQLTDYKALVGDPSDNIKGVPGVGPKTARSLLEKHQTLEALYGAVKKDEALAKKLGDTEGVAYAAKRLVVLRKDVPLGVGDIKDLAWEVQKDALAKYFKRMGFASLAKEVVQEAVAKSDLVPPKEPHRQGSIW